MHGNAESKAFFVFGQSFSAIFIKRPVATSLLMAAIVLFGVIAGVMVVVGFTILVFRRRTVGRVFQVTTRSDKIMYVVLGTVLLLGIGAYALLPLR